ncbi:MAG: hypothetical protein A2044_07440 [Candidatus Firestonebacteria bacterium GWA2_43_8]|nr:MAG: hypothetical protein A2044_07440 [Candidatus Firestonebacteria bacterium GWA2_43_8]
MTLPGDIIVEKKLEPGFPDPGKLHMIDVAIPEDFSAFGDGNSCTLTASLEMGKKIFPVRWAVEASQAEDPDRKVLRIPLPYAFDRNKK